MKLWLLPDRGGDDPLDRPWVGACAVAFVSVATSLLVLLEGSPVLRVAVPNNVEGHALKAVARSFGEHYRGTVEVFDMPETSSLDFAVGADVVLMDDVWLPMWKSRLQSLEQVRPESAIVEPARALCETADGSPEAGKPDVRCFPFAVDAQVLLAAGSAHGLGNDETTHWIPIGSKRLMLDGFLRFLFTRYEAAADSGATTTSEPIAKAFLSFRAAGRKVRATSEFEFTARFLSDKGAGRTAWVWSRWIMAAGRLGFEAGVPSPSSSDENSRAQAVLRAHVLAIPAGASNGRVARSFIEFALSEDSQRLAAELGSPPALSTAYDDPGLNARYPWFEHQREYLGRAIPRPRLERWSEFETRVSEGLSDLMAIRRARDAESRAARAADEVLELLHPRPSPGDRSK